MCFLGEVGEVAASSSSNHVGQERKRATARVLAAFLCELLSLPTHLLETPAHVALHRPLTDWLGGKLGPDTACVSFFMSVCL